MKGETPMKELRIKLSDSPSKAEETEVLQKIVEYFRDTPTYLTHLFTPELLSWSAKKIREDIVPNLFNWYFSEQKEYFTERERANKLQNALSDRNKEAETLRDEAQEYCNKYNELMKNHHHLQTDRDNKYDELRFAVLTTGIME